MEQPLPVIKDTQGMHVKLGAIVLNSRYFLVDTCTAVCHHWLANNRNTALNKEMHHTWL